MPVRGGGFIQGYNAQNMTSQDKLIIATELTGDTADCPSFEPMIGQPAGCRPHRRAPPAPPAARQPGPAAASIGLVLADAGYCSEHNLTSPGPDRLIATGKHRDLEKTARHPGQRRTRGRAADEPIAAMPARLATEEGITAYRQRGHIAETPHGHIKHNMGLRQLSMRGKPKASAEWTFTATVHNLFKALSTGHLTSQALTALAS